MVLSSAHRGPWVTARAGQPLPTRRREVKCSAGAPFRTASEPYQWAYCLIECLPISAARLLADGVVKPGTMRANRLLPHNAPSTTWWLSSLHHHPRAAVIHSVPHSDHQSRISLARQSRMWPSAITWTDTDDITRHARVQHRLTAMLRHLRSRRPTGSTPFTRSAPTSHVTIDCSKCLECTVPACSHRVLAGE
jgi:hypothetical protein